LHSTKGADVPLRTYTLTHYSIAELTVIELWKQQNGFALKFFTDT